MERDMERGWRGEEDAAGGMWSLRDSIQCSCNAGRCWAHKCYTEGENMSGFFILQ